MDALEQPVTFPCMGETLVGVLHRAQSPSHRGVLVVVGGPQYRVGSHRQFVLLARHLSHAGIPVLRFDYRGMGDSTGQARTFEDIGADIRAAIDAFVAHLPELKDLVIWGLCDAASAACFYAPTDPRVTGLVLLNPWVRSPEGEARAYLRHYYWQRLVSADFWRKLASGRFEVRAALGSFSSLLRRALASAPGAERADSGERPLREAAGPIAGRPLADRMLEGLEHFPGRTLLVLSGNDLTAAEFRDAVAASQRWRRWARRQTVARRDLPEADHTFSRREWRDLVAELTSQWIREF